MVHLLLETNAIVIRLSADEIYGTELFCMRQMEAINAFSMKMRMILENKIK